MLQNLNLTQLRTTIAGLGTDNKSFKTIKSNKLAVITSTRESSKLAQEISKIYAAYNPRMVDDKNIHIAGFDIVVKQHRHQRDTIAKNISNEHKFVEYVNQSIKDNGNEPLDITISSNARSFKLNSIVEASHVGNLDPRSGSKADTILWSKSGQKYPISLKQDNASRWGSPDLELKNVAEKFYTYVLKKGYTTVLAKNNIYSLNPPIGFKLNDRIANYMVFGNDIKPNGAVVIKTWDGSDFNLSHEQNGSLNIKCSYLYRSYGDLAEKHIPYFVMRNDMSRSVASNIIPPGIRYEVVYEGGGKRGVKLIEYHAS